MNTSFISDVMQRSDANSTSMDLHVAAVGSGSGWNLERSQIGQGPEGFVRRGRSRHSLGSAGRGPEIRGIGCVMARRLIQSGYF